MNEKRSNPRKNTDGLIKALDLNTDELLGTLVNISKSGFLLVGSHPIEPKRVYQLRLELEPPIAETEAIECGAESLWADSAPEGSSHWTGFQIIDINEDDAKSIEELFEQTET
jgi:hypothetical protein